MLTSVFFSENPSLHSVNSPKSLHSTFVMKIITYVMKFMSHVMKIISDVMKIISDVMNSVTYVMNFITYVLWSHFDLSSSDTKIRTD